MTGRGRGVFPVAGHAVETLEHLPAARQRVVKVDGPQKGLDRLRCLAQLDEAAPAFLMQAAEARMVLLERRERLEGGRDLPQVALRDGLAQERLPLPRGLLQHGRHRREHLGKAALPEQFAQRGCAAGGGGWSCTGGGGIHATAKKRADLVVRPSY